MNFRQIIIYTFCWFIKQQTCYALYYANATSYTCFFVKKQKTKTKTNSKERMEQYFMEIFSFDFE